MTNTQAADEKQMMLTGMADPCSLMHAILSLPKVDLHRHLTGCIDVVTAIQVSARFAVPFPTYDYGTLEKLLTSKASGGNLREYFGPWQTLNKLFVCPEAVQELVLRAVAEAASDNVIYQELRMGPTWFLGSSDYGFDDFLAAVEAGIAEGERRFGTITRCILGLPRHVFCKIPVGSRNKMFSRLISSLQPRVPKTFVGVDLNGDEEVAGGELFEPFFRQARESNLGVTVHAGEVGPASNVAYAVESLGASRIGHGLAAAGDPTVLALLAERSCALEICPSSYLALDIIQRVNQLPVATFKGARVPLVVCTDNPARCKTSLSQELYKFAQGFSLSLEDVIDGTMLAINYSFAEEETKAKLRSRVNSWACGASAHGGASLG